MTTRKMKPGNRVCGMGKSAFLSVDESDFQQMLLKGDCNCLRAIRRSKF